jgi:hypothetical protein
VSRRLAYADPPYIGRAHYYDHPDAKRWNTAPAHIELMTWMDAEFDGWALSCSSPSLVELLPGAPERVRVAAWVKTFAPGRRGQRVQYRWEPVLFRAPAIERPGDPYCRDWTASHLMPAGKVQGLVGAKPEDFVRWMLSLLGWQPGDEVCDLFPGTGTVERVLLQGALFG